MVTSSQPDYEHLLNILQYTKSVYKKFTTIGPALRMVHKQEGSYPNENIHSWKAIATRAPMAPVKNDTGTPAAEFEKPPSGGTFDGEGPVGTGWGTEEKPVDGAAP